MNRKRQDTSPENDQLLTNERKTIKEQKQLNEGDSTSEEFNHGEQYKFCAGHKINKTKAVSFFL